MKELAVNHPEAISTAVSLIEEGEVIAFPTDTVYGIGVSAFNPRAVNRLYQVKQREISKAIPILIGQNHDLEKVVSKVSTDVEELIRVFWPGPLTLILPIRTGLPANLSPGNTIGVRHPDLKFTRDLLCRTGPLAVTSANISGQPSARSAPEVKDQLKEQMALLLDGGKTPGGTASTVLDCTGTTWQILREGPVTLAEIRDTVDR